MMGADREIEDGMVDDDIAGGAAGAGTDWSLSGSKGKSSMGTFLKNCERGSRSLLGSCIWFAVGNDNWISLISRNSLDEDRENWSMTIINGNDVEVSENDKKKRTDKSDFVSVPSVCDPIRLLNGPPPTPQRKRPHISADDCTS